MLKALVTLQFLKRGKDRVARLEIIDDASGQLIALVTLDPAQFTRLMSSDAFAVRAEVAPVVAKALADAQDC